MTSGQVADIFGKHTVIEFIDIYSYTIQPFIHSVSQSVQWTTFLPLFYIFFIWLLLFGCHLLSNHESGVSFERSFRLVCLVDDNVQPKRSNVISWNKQQQKKNEEQWIHTHTHIIRSPIYKTDNDVEPWMFMVARIRWAETVKARMAPKIRHTDTHWKWGWERESTRIGPHQKESGWKSVPNETGWQAGRVERHRNWPGRRKR